MTEIAALGLKADSSGVVAATEDLKSLAGAADQAEKAADKLSGGAKKADDAVKREGDSARKAAGDNKRLGDEVRTTEGAMHRMARAAGTLSGILLSAFSIRAAARMANEWSDMQSVVGAAIRDMAAAPTVMNEIVRLANASYSSLEQTARGFSSNVSALRDLGISTRGALDYTEALNHALVLTATKGQQAESVQNALSRAMAVGRLNAQGLETVLANGGEVAQALADELGVNVNSLRSLASQGKITGDVIANAMINRVVELRDRAEEMPATIGDAFTRLRTNLTAFTGQLDQVIGTSGGVFSAIMLLADNIDMVAGYATAAALGIGAMFLPAIWGAVTATTAWAASLWGVSAALAATGIGAFVVVAGTLVGKFLELARETGSVTAAITVLKEAGSVSLEWLGAGAKALGDVFYGVTQQIRAYFTDLWASVQSGFASMMEAIQAGVNGMVAGLNKISFDRPEWMGGGRFGINIQEATFADGYRRAAEESATTANSMREAAGEAFKLAGMRFDNLETPAAALRRAREEAEATRAALDGDGAGSTGAQSTELSGGGGKSGGGSSGVSGRLDSLINELSTERELLTDWYNDRLALIQSYNDLELEALGGRQGAAERLEAEHLSKLRDLRDQERANELSAQKSMYGELTGLLGMFGNESRAAAIASIAINTALRLAETAQNTAAAQMRAYAELGPIAGAAAAAKIGLYGKAQMGLIAAAGAARGLGGGRSGGGGSSSGGSPAASAPQEPIRATLDGIKPNQLYTGQALIDLFEAVQKEAGNRGIVWKPV